MSHCGISRPSKHFWHFKVDMWDPNSSGDLHLQLKSWYISHVVSFLYKSNPQSIQCVFLFCFEPNNYLRQNLTIFLLYVLIHKRPSAKCHWQTVVGHIVSLCVCVLWLIVYQLGILFLSCSHTVRPSVDPGEMIMPAKELETLEA